MPPVRVPVLSFVVLSVCHLPHCSVTVSRSLDYSPAVCCAAAVRFAPALFARGSVESKRHHLSTVLRRVVCSPVGAVVAAALSSVELTLVVEISVGG